VGLWLYSVRGTIASGLHAFMMVECFPYQREKDGMPAHYFYVFHGWLLHNLLWVHCPSQDPKTRVRWAL